MATLGFSDTKARSATKTAVLGSRNRYMAGCGCFENLARRALETSDPEPDTGRRPICIRDFRRMRPTSCGVPIFTPTIAPRSCGCSDRCKS
ncbi:MAG: hypothetical protein ACLUIX_03520 [Oscillospiraceae bacterium]